MLSKNNQEKRTDPFYKSMPVNIGNYSVGCGSGVCCS